MRTSLGFALIAAVSSGGCSGDKPAPPPAVPATTAAAPAARSGANSCPATGLWAECQVLYHLERAGVAPHLDSTATPEDKLKGRPMMIKIGMNAMLEVFLYPDSASRIADEKTLDSTQFVDATAPQTMKRERTLIASANLLGLFTSLNSHQRERVSDALTAGPPQPSTHP